MPENRLNSYPINIPLYRQPFPTETNYPPPNFLSEYNLPYPSYRNLNKKLQKKKLEATEESNIFEQFWHKLPKIAKSVAALSLESNIKQQNQFPSFFNFQSPEYNGNRFRRDLNQYNNDGISITSGKNFYINF